jgi:hypothetical protein
VADTPGSGLVEQVCEAIAGRVLSSIRVDALPAHLEAGAPLVTSLVPASPPFPVDLWNSIVAGLSEVQKTLASSASPQDLEVLGTLQGQITSVPLQDATELGGNVELTSKAADLRAFLLSLLSAIIPQLTSASAADVLAVLSRVGVSLSVHWDVLRDGLPCKQGRDYSLAQIPPSPAPPSSSPLPLDPVSGLTLSFLLRPPIADDALLQAAIDYEVRVVVEASVNAADVPRASLKREVSIPVQVAGLGIPALLLVSNRAVGPDHPLLGGDTVLVLCLRRGSRLLDADAFAADRLTALAHALKSLTSIAELAADMTAFLRGLRFVAEAVSFVPRLYLQTLNGARNLDALDDDIEDNVNGMYLLGMRGTQVVGYENPDFEGSVQFTYAIGGSGIVGAIQDPAHREIESISLGPPAAPVLPGAVVELTVDELTLNASHGNGSQTDLEMKIVLGAVSRSFPLKGVPVGTPWSPEPAPRVSVQVPAGAAVRATITVTDVGAGVRRAASEAPIGPAGSDDGERPKPPFPPEPSPPTFSFEDTIDPPWTKNWTPVATSAPPYWGESLALDCAIKPSP